MDFINIVIKTSMKESLWMILSMEKELLNTQMEINIMAISEMEKKMVRVHINIIMEINLLESGLMIKKTVMENIVIILLENITKGSGKTIQKMDRENTYIIMVIDILAIF